MQEGIHILNKTAITELSDSCGVIMIICIIIALIAFLIVLLSNNSIVVIASGIVAFISGVIIILSPFFASEVETGQYRYEVIIDESVKFSDIYDNYEVVEQRGEIWVLEEKED